ncbi:MAG TPA: hypothetical protein PKN45_08500, partial [Candidatus Limiplasma sp.]|nr:hypothetical protein [Candidatus Limiplasma sp.]
MLLSSYILIIVFGLYSIGPYVIIGAGLLMLVWGFLRLRKRNRKRLSALWHPSLLTFVFLCGCVIVCIGNGQFSSHDAYSFWARAVREMYVKSTFYINAESNIAHSDYNPMFASLQYSVVRVFGWSNAGLLYITAMPVIIVATMISDRVAWKNWYRALLTALALLLVYVSLDTTLTVTSVLIDGPLAMIFMGGVIVLSDTHDGDTVLPTVLACAVLPGVKIYVGFLFAIALAIILLIYRMQKKQRTLTVVMAVVMMLFMQLSWSGIYNYDIACKNQNESIARAEYLGSESQKSTSIPFRLKYLFEGNYRNKKISASLGNVTIGQCCAPAIKQVKSIMTSKVATSRVKFWQMYASLFILLIITAFLLKREERQRYAKMLFVVVITNVIYTAGIMVTLAVQPQTISSFSRYLSVSYLCVFVCALYWLCRMERATSQLVVLFVIVILLLGFTPQYYSVALDCKPYPSATLAEATYTDRVMQYSQGKRTLVIDNRDYHGAYVSTSGLAYAYMYVALPDYLNAIVLRYQNKNDYAMITKDYLTKQIVSMRINRIVLLVEDQKLANAVSIILGANVSVAGPAVFDVQIADGQPVYLPLTES